MSGIDSGSGVSGRAPLIKVGGMAIPAVGLGTYALHGKTCEQAVSTALKLGFRLIDTASFYGNEREVGRGVRASGLSRDEVVVQTKLYPSQYGTAARAIDEALAKLDLEYIDILFLHHPAYNDVSAYRAIEQAVRDGKVRAAGISCYYLEETPVFLEQVELKPLLVQNEIHPYYQDAEVTSFLQSLGLVVQSWYPLGGRGYTRKLLADPLIVSLAERHQKSPAQIVLRWELQRGIAVIPGSSNPEHLKENLALFDFALSEEEMAAMASMERAEKHDWY